MPRNGVSEVVCHEAEEINENNGEGYGYRVEVSETAGSYRAVITSYRCEYYEQVDWWELAQGRGTTGAGALRDALARMQRKGNATTDNVAFLKAVFDALDELGDTDGSVPWEGGRRARAAHP